jgi:hypothetical protein
MRHFSLPAPRPVLWPLRPVASADVTDEIARDGRRIITVRHAELEGVTPEMVFWWYGHITGDMRYAGAIWPRYLVWHPLDHIAFQVVRAGPDGRIGPGARMHILEAFQRDPRNLLDITVEAERFEANTAVMHKQVAGTRIMRLTNEFRAAPRGTMYVTRMEIGASGLAAALGMNAVVRRGILGGAKAHAWARHHVEEIGNLTHFLPELWASETGLARASSVARH